LPEFRAWTASVPQALRLRLVETCACAVAEAVNNMYNIVSNTYNIFSQSSLVAVLSMAFPQFQLSLLEASEDPSNKKTIPKANKDEAKHLSRKA
jgi:hypothetical protein